MTYPGCARFEPQIEPSAGDQAIAYMPNGMRVSFAGSAGLPGSFHSAVRLPVPTVSTISGVQPCDLAASCVCQYSLVLIQPTTATSPCVLLLSHSVLLASSAKFR